MSKKQNRVAVQEAIHHGDYHEVRYLEVDLADQASVLEMLNSCSYLKLPPPSFGKAGKGEIVLVSRSYDEILEARKALGLKVAAELADKGHAEAGWVDYRVMRGAHRPILQAEGWPAEQIARCGL